MEKISSYEEYKVIVGDFRKKCRRAFSNNYFMPARIKRYIDLNRAYYDKTDSALVLYFDEESCYRVCIYANPDLPLEIKKQDKRLYFRVTYKEGKEEKELPVIEEGLQRLGFEHVSKTVQVKGEIDTLIARCEGVERFARSMERKGFHIVHAKPEQFEEVENLILASEIIKDYHIDFMTNEEKAALPGGAYCYISDKDGNMCGASICVIEGEVAHGIGVAIKEQYKLLGFAPILADYRFKWLRDLGIKYGVGWIVTTNSESIRYHKSLEYEFTDKYADEWILE